MYKLNEKRSAIVKPILERYREQLFSHGSFDPGGLQRELRDALGCGYLEVRSIAMQLLKKQPRFKNVIAFYMAFGGAPGVISQFKPLLAKVYGMRYYDSPDRPTVEERYWSKSLRRVRGS